MSRVTRIVIAVFVAILGSLVMGGMLARSELPNAPSGGLWGMGAMASETLSNALLVALCFIPASIALVWRGSKPKPKRRMSAQHIPPRLDTAKAKEVVQMRIDPDEDEDLGPAEPNRRRRRRVRRPA